MTTSDRTFAWWQGLGALAIAGMAAFAIHAIEPEFSGRAQPSVNADACVTSDDGFRTIGGVSGFQVVLSNTCEVKVRCTVYVNVTNSRGSNTGRTTLLLAAASPAGTSQKSWMFDTGQASGMASMSRECKGG